MDSYDDNYMITTNFSPRTLWYIWTKSMFRSRFHPSVCGIKALSVHRTTGPQVHLISEVFINPSRGRSPGRWVFTLTYWHRLAQLAPTCGNEMFGREVQIVFKCKQKCPQPFLQYFLGRQCCHLSAAEIAQAREAEDIIWLATSLTLTAAVSPARVASSR